VSPGRRAAVRFTEEMKGYAAFGADDYRTGWEQGKASATRLMFHLTIAVDDLSSFLADPMHETDDVVGWIEFGAIGSGRLPVQRGIFNLFSPGLAPGRTTMRYRLWFADDAGRPLTLVGFKDVGDDPGFDVWHDTTSLATRILDGHVDKGADDGAHVRAQGILVIKPLDFAKQLTTFRGRLGGLLRFGGMFVGALWRTYRGRVKRA
jgi:cholesterol oxidase